MNPPPRESDPQPEPSSPPAAATSPAAPGAGDPKPADALTPEEQMERFAQELKETDWGHQPC